MGLWIFYKTKNRKLPHSHAYVITRVTPANKTSLNFAALKHGKSLLKTLNKFVNNLNFKREIRSSGVIPRCYASRHNQMCL